MKVFGALSLQPKIPFPATDLGREAAPYMWLRFQLLGCLIRRLQGVPQLFGIEPERLKLPAPFGRRIAQPLDANAAGQATFYCCFDKIGREEGERDGHIDLPNAAILASAKLCDRGNST